MGGEPLTCVAKGTWGWLRPNLTGQSTWVLLEGELTVGSMSRLSPRRAAGRLHD